ncbi:MAG TPA: FixH family protein [Allosphingosinicella sp.]|jgi:hypothetical protein
MSRNTIRIMFALCVALPLSFAAATGGAAFAKSQLSAGLNQSLERTTENGAFRVMIASPRSPIPLRQIHGWSVQVTDRAGRPVTGATFKVGGGMPQHGHGLPTAPTVQPAGPAGAYLLNGMKFSMDGWWELKLDIAAGGVTDRVTFNIVL